MDPRTVYFARTSAEASIVQNWLESAGIEARTFSGEVAGGAFEFVESEPQVIVNADDYDKAMEVVEQYKEELKNENDMADVSDAEGQFDWPICPICDELRYATCEKCGAEGSEFSTDECENGAKATCLACSEETKIALLDTCKFCQHDFEADDNQSDFQSPFQSSESVDSNRVMLLLIGFAVLVVILAAWFIFATN